jgi:hypothetical protein
MKPSKPRLLRHLRQVIALKLVLLLGLWWGWVREQQVPVNSEAVAAHLSAPTSAESTKGTSP